MKRPRSGRPRRPTERREHRQIIRVLSEGAVTEPSFLAQWDRRNRHVHIELSDSGMGPLSLVQRARDYQQAKRRSRRNGRGVAFDEIDGRADPRH